MKVLMAADTVGGVFTYAVDLIAGLRREDVEVVLATFGPPATADQRRRISTAGTTAWYERDLALEWMEDPWAQLQQAQSWLHQLADEERPDLIHLNSYGHAGGDWPMPVVVVGHSCVWSWWRGVHGSSPPSKWDRYRRWVSRGLHGADAVIAPSAAMRDELIAIYGQPAAGIGVIHNGSEAPPAPAGLLKQPYALAAGRLWDAAKNLSLLETAAAALPAGNLRAAGDGPPSRGRTQRLERLGPLSCEALAVQRRRAAVFVAPARYEPFGLAVLEAARDRCALILSDIPSQRELWDQAARFVSPDDPQQLITALRDLLTDPTSSAELGERAQRRSERYGTAPMAAAYHRLYGQLAGNRQAVAR